MQLSETDSWIGKWSVRDFRDLIISELVMLHQRSSIHGNWSFLVAGARGIDGVLRCSPLYLFQKIRKLTERTTVATSKGRRPRGKMSVLPTRPFLAFVCLQSCMDVYMVGII